MTLFLMRKFDDFREKTSVPLARMRRLSLALDESKKKLRRSSMMQSRNVEDNISDWAGMVARLAIMKEEMRTFSPASLVAGVLVLTKAVRVIGRLIDVALDEMLKRQSVSASFLLLGSSISGWVTLYTFRNSIVENLQASTEARSRRFQPGVGEPTTGGLEEGAEWYMQLLRNLKRLPNVFWLSQAATWLVGLQVSQGVGVRTLRFSSRSVLGSLLFQLAGLLVVGLAYQAYGLSAVQRGNIRRKTQRLLTRNPRSFENRGRTISMESEQTDPGAGTGAENSNEGIDGAEDVDDAETAAASTEHPEGDTPAARRSERFHSVEDTVEDDYSAEDYHSAEDTAPSRSASQRRASV